MQTIEITTKKDFDSVIEHIISQNNDLLLVFRGQAQDKPLVPSIRRGEGKPSLPTASCIPWLTINWQEIGKKLFNSSVITKTEQVKVDAVMQHYGYRSFFIDVTADPNIALWFALHKFHSQKSPIYVDEELKSAVFQWSRFLPSDTGFVYIIAVPKKQIKRYIDLTQVLPHSALRVHKQKAGALYCYGNLDSIEKFVVAKLKIISDNWFQKSVFNSPTYELFPFPRIDKFYRQLCTIPYFVRPESEMNDIKMGHPLLGYFPIYAESAKEIVKEYLPLTRIIDQIHPALTWNIATAVTEFENQRFKASGAIRILLYRIILDKISQTKPICNVLDEEALPSNNLIFEFEPDASLVDLSTKAVVNIVRGLWVIIGKTSIRISQIIDSFDKLCLDHMCVYSKTSLNLIAKECNCPDHNSDIKLVIEIARSLADGTLFLEKANKDYLKLEPHD